MRPVCEDLTTFTSVHACPLMLHSHIVDAITLSIAACHAMSISLGLCTAHALASLGLQQWEYVAFVLPSTGRYRYIAINATSHAQVYTKNEAG